MISQMGKMFTIVFLKDCTKFKLLEIAAFGGPSQSESFLKYLLFSERSKYLSSWGAIITGYLVFNSLETQNSVENFTL